MSYPIARTLSKISEATERSESAPQSSYEPVVIPETSRYSDNHHGAELTIPRASIFSSETSYGEPLPPGQSTFKNLGLGVPSSVYEKSLPSLPRNSVAAFSTSAQSAQKTESARGSVARSDTSKKSVMKPESSRHSLAKSKSQTSQHSRDPESPTRLVDVGDKPSPVKKPASVNSESTLGSKSAVDAPPSFPVPTLPYTNSSRTLSTVSTHSSSSTHSHSSSHSSTSSTSDTSATISTTTRSSHPTSLSSVHTQSQLRTLDDVMDEVTTSLAVRTKMSAETMLTPDGTKIGVCGTMSRGDDQRFMLALASKLHHFMTLHSSYLFALIPSGLSTSAGHVILVFCGSPQPLVTKASILAGLRFKTRLAELQDSAGTWVGQLEPAEQHDVWDARANYEEVLWDIVRKAANPFSATEPPPGSRSIDDVLADARSRLDRLSPAEAFAEAMRDGVLVDIRPAKQRTENGTIPGALIIERNVLEWRFDPRCIEGRLPIADRYDLRVIVYCQEGYTSSLAATSLQDLGLWQATDINGGFARWKQEGFPVTGVPTDALTAETQSVAPTTPRLAAE